MKIRPSKASVIAKLFVLFAFLLTAHAHAQERAKKQERVTINFVDVDISSLVRVISDMTGRNFIYDDTLTGKVTVIAPGKLTPDEAFSLFVSALELKNFALVPVDGSYKIVPANIARQSGIPVAEKSTERLKAEESFIIRLLTLENISAQEVFPVVQPLVSRNGQISVFGSRNAILIADKANNIDKIAKILATLDLPPEETGFEIVYLKHAQADAIAQMLRREAQRRTAMSRRGEAGAADAEASIVPDPRLNAIILSGDIAQREHLKSFIAMLDVAPPEASSRINVYYLENADASELADVLASLITGERERRATGARRPGAPATAPPIPAPIPAGEGALEEISGQVSITPHQATNSLVIMASTADYANLVNVIQKLDRRPKQVFVEAMITEVTVDKILELGTRWRITAEKGGEPVVIGGAGTIDASAIQTIVNGLSGLTVGGLGNIISVPITRPDGTTTTLTTPGFAALFSASDFRDAINVLSTPHILTSDNSEAEIVVGENVPFLSRLERETGTLNQPVLQSIERRDIGVKLQIKPKISEGDFVKLDIYQEISAISPTLTTGAADIVTSKRSARTSVFVKDNQTVVIGGLIQNRQTNNVIKVPFLGDIPFLGAFFRFKRDQKQKTNLLVFITPFIVDELEQLEELKNRKELEFRSPPGIQKKEDAK